MSMEEKYIQKAKKIIEEKKLVSVMNNTKWSKLFSSIVNELPFPPICEVKYLLQEEEYHLTKDSKNVIGDYSDFFIKDVLFMIEWIEIRPRIIRHRGILISDEIESIEDEFREILRKYRIPFKFRDGTYCIYGYTSCSTELEFVR